MMGRQIWIGSGGQCGQKEGIVTTQFHTDADLLPARIYFCRKQTGSAPITEGRPQIGDRRLFGFEGPGFGAFVGAGMRGCRQERTGFRFRQEERQVALFVLTYRLDQNGQEVGQRLSIQDRTV